MNKVRNLYFELRNNKTNEILAHLDTKINDTIFNNIKFMYFGSDIVWNEFYKNPRKFMMDRGIKQYVKNIYPELIHKFSSIINEDIMKNDNIDIHLISVYDYRNLDEEFDNECKFVEYIINEKKNEDRHTDITEEILVDAGFEFLEHETKLLADYQKEVYDINNYKVFRKWTNDTLPIKLDIENAYNNSGRKWHLHIDNECCETIGCADIDNVYQFNLLMEVFGSKFKL